LSVNDNQVDVTPNSGFSGTVQFEIAPTDSTHLTDAENGQGFADLVTLTVQSQQPATISGNVLTVNGTSGPDTIVVDLGSGTYETEVNGNIQQLSATGVTSVVVNGGDGNDVITLGPGMVAGASVQGGPGDDIITGGPGNDTLGGGQGNDTIAGTQGDDLIHGGAGNDSIGGGQGNDQIFGGLGNDTITGGQGDDTLDGGAGNNVLHGGLGNDIFFAINGLADTLYGGAGANIAHIDQGLDVIPNNDIQTILFT
jgi:Ca2+-binding RTX toxin-like protein